MLMIVQLLILNRIILEKRKVEVHAQNHITEKKSNPSKLNSEELRKIYINLMEYEKEKTSLILDSKTTLLTGNLL